MAIRITTRYGDKFANKYARTMKKEIPFFLRPFFKTTELRKLVDEVLLVREELVLDAETCAMLVSRGYSKDGLLILETRGWQPCTNLPPEDYAVPKNFTRLRPKTLDQAKRLDSQTPTTTRE